MYYSGIAGFDTQGAPQQQAQPYTNLMNQSLQVGGGQPMAVANPVASNALLNAAAKNVGPAPSQGAMSTGMAGNFGQIPEAVRQAAQRYNPGGAGYGDPSSSLFQRGLLGNYNQWESAYEKQGEEFVPWALRQGSGFNPSQVDLFGTVNQSAYNFNSPRGAISMANRQFDPISGQSMQLDSFNPNYQSLSRNPGDITKQYVADQFSNWRTLGATGVPQGDEYLKQYYESLMPNLFESQEQNQPYWDWWTHGVGQGILSRDDAERYNTIAQRQYPREDVTSGYGSMPGMISI